MLKSALVHLILFAFGALSLSPTFLGCQLQKPKNKSPLLGCPSGTIFVSPNDPRAHFKGVQQAILSL